MSNSLTKRRIGVALLVAMFVASIGAMPVSQAAMVGFEDLASASSTALATISSAGTNVVPMPQTYEGPHGGTLIDYEVAPAGGTTEDPAVAYDTVSYEPIVNVYQTLINYNGTDTSTFVPTLATCVPGTTQCQADYGSNFTGIYNALGQPFTGTNGLPTYWTYVIDPAAQFYNNSGTPNTPVNHHWSVYPTDVEYSIARTLAWSTTPSIGSTAGWILAQALTGYAGYPGAPLDQAVFGSMLINDSAFCPMAWSSTPGNGCVTFVANGGGADWPEFNEFIADNLGGSIVPCGWFQTQTSGADPAFPASGEEYASCPLPGGGLSNSHAGTLTTAFTNAISALGSKWTTFVDQGKLNPANEPAVRFHMAGSGPYTTLTTVVSSIGYTLIANPSYAQPSGCGGNPTMFPGQYTGYCDPAVGTYIPNVVVKWDADDSNGIANIGTNDSTTADFAGIEATHTSTLLSDVAAGDLNLAEFPTISNFFLPFDLDFSATNYANELHQTTPTIPNNFFAYTPMREFLANAYPYTTAYSTAFTVDGLQDLFEASGPIPYGMGNYYPTNISYPAGNPWTNLSGYSQIGQAEWWWAQMTNPSSVYYDPQLHGYSSGHPLTFPIIGEQANPALDTAIGDYITDVELISNNTLQPFSFDLSFPQLVTYSVSSLPGQNPMPFYNLGWAPDYPDPTDYLTAMAEPNATYTAGDSVWQSLATDNNTADWNLYSGGTWANLSYFSKMCPDNGANGVRCAMPNNDSAAAYNVAISYMAKAAPLAATNPERILIYNMVQHILTALALYVWYGQENEFPAAAPWINLATVNENVMIGGGNDQVFFQVRYSTGTIPITFTEKGLPKGSTWGVDLGTKPKSATVTGSSSTIVFSGGTANLQTNYTVHLPSGYFVTAATVPSKFTPTGPTTVGLTVGPYNGYSVSFGVLDSPGLGASLPPGVTWAMTLSGKTIKTTTVTVTGDTAIGFPGLTNGTYKYSLKTVPNGFGVVPVNVLCAGPKGTLIISGSNSINDECFYQEMSTLNISEKGLLSTDLLHTGWSINISGPSEYYCPLGGTCQPYNTVNWANLPTPRNLSTTSSTYLLVTLPAGKKFTYYLNATFPSGYTPSTISKTLSISFSSKPIAEKLSVKPPKPSEPLLAAARRVGR